MNERPYIYDEAANLTTLRDPMFLLDGDTYYLTGTQAPYWEGPNDGVHLWSSKDLKKWTDLGNIIRRSELPESFWGIDRFWAPELFKTNDGRYVVTFNSRNDTEAYRHIHSVGIAVSDCITGPYTILNRETPLTEGLGVCNDASVFCDDDGQFYITYNFYDGVIHDLYISGLDLENGKILDTEIVCHLGKKGEWDSIGIEGPCILKRHGIYFYWYSSWTNGYAAGILTADNIHGPWKKYEGNPLISESPLYIKAGHNNVFRGKDGKDYISFHANLRDPADGDKERIFIREVEYKPDGSVIVK